MAKLLRADGTSVDVQPKNSKNFKRDELKSFVGRWIEVVRINDKDILVINEEAKLVGLPMNVQATELVSNNLIPGDYIAGDALICQDDGTEIV